MDDITPVQLWDFIMRKYKVSQRCEQELAKLDDMENPSEVARVHPEQAEAVALAVEYLSRLHHRET